MKKLTEFSLNKQITFFTYVNNTAYISTLFDKLNANFLKWANRRYYSMLP